MPPRSSSSKNFTATPARSWPHGPYPTSPPVRLPLRAIRALIAARFRFVMHAIPMIRAAGALAFTRFLDDAGMRVESQWSRFGLPPAALVEPERLLPLGSLVRFVDAAAHSQGVDLGLRIGERSTLESVGTFGATVRAAPTLGRAFNVARDAVQSHNSAASYWVVHDGGTARLCRRMRSGAPESRQIDLFTVALMTKLVRTVAGPDWTPARVELQSKGRLDLHDTGLLGDARIAVAQPVTSIELPRHLLSKPLAAAPRPAPPPPGFAAWLRSAPPKDFAGSVDTLISALLEADRVDVTTAAEAAGMTVRSFQRRLAESGLSHSAVLDRVRERTAIRMLEDPEVSMIDVAVALGYSDAAHFTRAFRRWTSATPTTYRQLLLREPLTKRRRA